MKNKSIEEKRKERKHKTAEDFTPLFLVDEILDRIPSEVWEENKEFLDKACGNGNILVCILKRKLSLNHHPIQALKTIFGADIMRDNINEARLRLFKIALNYLKTKELQIEAIQILKTNIKWVPLKNYPNGSLDYDFQFKDKINPEEALKTLNNVIQNNLLDTVQIS